jgi:S1-C subfamily serine protease
MAVSLSVSADNGEDFFKQAPGYTVQIRTAVDMPFSQDKRSSFIGAGFVVDSERGWIMTNAHVAARSPSQNWIKFRHGEYREATKLYVDPYLDLAFFELDVTQREGLQAAHLECGDLPPVGHAVGAFGHPWGLSYTGTRGIISGVTSRMDTEMLQTDAPINGGNSGGPLISLKTGHIVGISTSSMNQDDDQNTNFAVPMKYACRVLELLQAGRDPSPPKLSTMFFKDLDDEGKLTVAQTDLDAAQLDWRVGDTIVSVAGTPDEIRNEAQLVHALRGRLDNVELGVLRGGKRVKVAGRLQGAVRVTERQGVYASGILIAPAGFRDGRELNIAQPLMVHSVERGTLGESLEIEKWDLLVSVDGESVTGLEELFSRFDAARTREQSVVLAFKRWSNGSDRVYDHVERTILVDELEFVGPAPKEFVATRD